MAAHRALPRRHVQRPRNFTLRTFYTRLVAAGEPRRAALTAVAHELLTILDTIPRAGTSWAPLPSGPA